MEDIKVIREEFKKYLYKQVADNKLSKVDADTQYSDADYIRKHEDDLLISYYSIFISNERFEQALLNLKKQFQNQGKSDSTFYAYKRALNSYKMFFEEYIKDQLKVYLAKYFTHKSSPNYDEQYKYDYFAKNSYIFDDLNDLSEKFIQLGSPNFVPYVWKSSMFRHLAFKHSFQFSQILENLFNETLPINTRIEDFRKDIKEILLKDSEWNNKDMIDPSVESASFFLSLKYPNKYLLFTRIKPYTNFSKDFHLGLEKFNNEDRYIAWIDYCKNNLIPLLNNYCNSNCNLLDCQDFIWFVFNQNKGDNMSLKEKFIKYVYDVVYKSNQSYLQYGKKIENLDNVILNLTNKQIYEIQNSEELSSLLFQLKKISEWQDYNHKNGNGIPYAILNTHYRKFIQNNIVKDNSMKQEANFAQEKIYQPLNQILYGPPGTGKTYNTIVKAMEIIGSNSVNMKDEKGNFKNNYSLDEYKKLKEEFDNYKNDDRIEFITFHQSYSYEEFVEGINPDLDTEFWNEPVDKLTYKGTNGVFKAIANRALFDRLNIKTGQQDAILDFKNLKELFIEEYSVGAIFKTGTKNAEFRIDKYTKDSARITPINGKYTYSITFKYLEEAYNKKMSSQSEIATINGVASGLSCYYYAIYEKLLDIKKSNDNNQVKFNISEISDEDKLQLVKDYYEGKIEINNGKKGKPYVLIIDEINRGNISKIFGELITLIEEDKRENLSVKLPYSQETFTVPKNLYIIGTMNTSDRSIASIDIALRRRFKFVEMMPKKELVADFGINFAVVFEYLNTKIKILLDRDHQIGHSYFIKTKYENAGIDELKTIWFSEILPLLNEYFYCDWEKLKLIIPGFIKPLEVPPALKSECDDSIYEFKTYDEISDFEKALKQEKFEQV